MMDQWGSNGGDHMGQLRNHPHLNFIPLTIARPKQLRYSWNVDSLKTLLIPSIITKYGQWGIRDLVSTSVSPFRPNLIQHTHAINK